MEPIIVSGHDDRAAYAVRSEGLVSRITGAGRTEFTFEEWQVIVARLRQEALARRRPVDPTGAYRQQVARERSLRRGARRRAKMRDQLRSDLRRHMGDVATLHRAYGARHGHPVRGRA